MADAASVLATIPIYKRTWFLTLAGVSLFCIVSIIIFAPSEEKSVEARHRNDSTYTAQRAAAAAAEKQWFAALPQHARDSVIAARTAAGVGKSCRDVIRQLKNDGLTFTFHKDTTRSGGPKYVGDYMGTSITFEGHPEYPTKASFDVVMGSDIDEAKRGLVVAEKFIHTYDPASVDWLVERVTGQDFHDSFSDSTIIGSRKYTMKNESIGPVNVFVISISAK